MTSSTAAQPPSGLEGQASAIDDLVAAAAPGLRVQLWSYNYAPEPSGIAPLSTALAGALSDRGHQVSVVAAHPHYPSAMWGRRLRPYREERDGIEVLRLPLWIGRETAGQRIRQELTYAAAQTLATPLLPGAEVIVAVSPSFPALAAAMAHARLRRVPWVLWLQDILPEGAMTTGMIDRESVLLSAARAFERAAYTQAKEIVVISHSFAENLRRKGVDPEKISVIYNPAPGNGGRRQVERRPVPGRVLCMGNIGHSQGLAGVVGAFQASEELEAGGAELRIAGDGVEAEAVRAAIATDRVTMLGVLFEELADELATAAVGLVTQRADITEFNVPSKLMNYMRHGVPVVGLLRPESEAARLIERSGAGWVLDAGHPEVFGRDLADVLADAGELRRRGEAGRAFAEREFTPEQAARRFDDVLRRAVRRAGASPR
jgi:putative colanic acid biosynthesis glycosyltransferase WcaI